MIHKIFNTSIILDTHFGVIFRIELLIELKFFESNYILCGIFFARNEVYRTIKIAKITVTVLKRFDSYHHIKEVIFHNRLIP